MKVYVIVSERVTSMTNQFHSLAKGTGTGGADVCHFSVLYITIFTEVVVTERNEMKYRFDRL